MGSLLKKRVQGTVNLELTYTPLDLVFYPQLRKRGRWLEEGGGRRGGVYSGGGGGGAF